MGRHRSFLPPLPSTCPSPTCAVSTSPSASSAATLPAPGAHFSVATCKSCCYKAQNPCHIHVLKQNNTLPDKPPQATAPLSEQPSTNSPSTGSSSRLASLQKLPHHFLNSLRTKKSLAKKDVASINKWRFMKLKEHMQGDVDVENEAYERYTQSIGLLEETFSLAEDAAVEPEAEAISSEERMEVLISEAKVRLKSDYANADSFKERIAAILDQKIKKLKERESSYEDDNPSDQNLDGHTKLTKLIIKQQMARTGKMNELHGKLTRTQSEDVLKPCLDIMSKLFGKEMVPPWAHQTSQAAMAKN